MSTKRKITKKAVKPKVKKLWYLWHKGGEDSWYGRCNGPLEKPGGYPPRKTRPVRTPKCIYGAPTCWVLKDRADAD